VGKKLGEDHVLDLDVVRSLGATAMTHDIAIRMTESGLPNTFVPAAICFSSPPPRRLLIAGRSARW